jgi:hypothetical protein
VTPKTSVGELHRDEPAIEDVVRKVYAGELLHEGV